MNGLQENQSSTSAQNVTVPIGTNIAKFIPLTQGQVAIVDAEDYEWLNLHKWYAYKHGRRYYARRQGMGRSTIEMHHAIIGKPPDGKVTDHVDGNGINNQKRNLRHISARENCQNRTHPKTSRFCGVNWRKDAKVWRAQITVKDKKIHLGLFKNEEDAAMAYIKACSLYGYGLPEQIPARMKMAAIWIEERRIKNG